MYTDLCKFINVSPSILMKVIKDLIRKRLILGVNLFLLLSIPVRIRLLSC